MRRARVRHEVLPQIEMVLGPGVAEALARTADQLRDDVEVLDALAAEVLASAREPGGQGAWRDCDDLGALEESRGPGGSVDVAVLAAAPRALRTRAIRAALVAWGAPAGSVSSVHVRAVEALVVDWSGQGPVSVPGLAVARVCGRLIPHLVTNPPNRESGSPGGRS